MGQAEINNRNSSLGIKCGMVFDRWKGWVMGESCLTMPPFLLFSMMMPLPSTNHHFFLFSNKIMIPGLKFQDWGWTKWQICPRRPPTVLGNRWPGNGDGKATAQALRDVKEGTHSPALAARSRRPSRVTGKPSLLSEVALHSALVEATLPAASRPRSGARIAPRGMTENGGQLPPLPTTILFSGEAENFASSWSECIIWYGSCFSSFFYPPLPVAADRNVDPRRETEERVLELTL